MQHQQQRTAPDLLRPRNMRLQLERLPLSLTPNEQPRPSTIIPLQLGQRAVQSRILYGDLPGPDNLVSHL